MYLDKRTYIGRWGNNRDKLKGRKTIKLPEGVKAENITEIIESVGYWRKANAIHKWFVDNCNNGDDDNGGDYYVSREQMLELKSLCETVIVSLKGSPLKTIQKEVGWSGGSPIINDIQVYENTSVAEELLPTQSGFFFGGTEYDQWYLKDLEETIKILDEALKDERGSYYYHSSW